ncbi:MAG: efflux RND transporter periplasmic adaptor subunit [Thermoanaerobacterales bacterium]|nr:efflux RND transporter periplasmic adaptor subunit [Thermoanaerobacterales bacterium]
MVSEGSLPTESGRGVRGRLLSIRAAAAKALPFFRRQPRRKLFIILGFLAVLGAGVGYRWLGGEAQAKYMTMPASQGSIVESISATGMVEAQKSIGLNFQNSGKIAAIFVKPGDYVKAGELLACLDTSSLEAELAQAKANYEANLAELRKLQAGPKATELAQAEADLIEAQSTYHNAEETLKANQALFEAGFLTRADLDRSVADRDAAAAKLRYAKAALKELQEGTQPEDLAAAEAQVQGALAGLQEAQNNLDAAELRAPWNGFVTDVEGEVGQHISGGGSNDDTTNGFISLLTSDLRLSIQVNEADIGRAKVGQTVTFTVNAYPERTFTGKVTRIAAEATTESNVQLYDVDASVDDPDQLLKAGMSASVRIIVNQKDDVITIPQAAITYAAKNQAIAASGGNEGGTRPATGSGKTTGAVPGGEPGSGKATVTREQVRARMEAAPGGATGSVEPKQGEGAEGNGKQATVLVLENGRPQLRHIVTGLSDASNIEVISGLDVGEQVIIGASTEKQATSSGTSGRSTTTRQMQPMGPPMMGR